MPSARDLIAYALPVLQSLYLGAFFHLLPPRIASHFDAAGTPHSYAPRALTCVIVFITAADVALLRFVRSKPQFFNLPAPRNSPQRVAQEAATQNALTWISLEIALLFSFVLWAIVQEGLHSHAPLKLVYLPIAVACNVILALIHIWGVVKASGT